MKHYKGNASDWSTVTQNVINDCNVIIMSYFMHFPLDPMNHLNIHREQSYWYIFDL